MQPKTQHIITLANMLNATSKIHYNVKKMKHLLLPVMQFLCDFLQHSCGSLHRRQGAHTMQHQGTNIELIL